MLINILLIILFSILLALTTDFLLKAVNQIAQETGLNDFSIANSLLAFGTSLPELTIAIQSALYHRSSLSLGNVLGSNIANLSIVIGGGALIGGSMKICKRVLNRNVYYTLLVAAAPLILIIDGQLDIFDGIILGLIFLIWKLVSLTGEKNYPETKLEAEKKIKLDFKKLFLPILQLFLCLGGILLLSNLLVNQGIIIAETFKIPPIIIGIFLTGLGSSLPELAISIKSAQEKTAEIAMGNVLGSVAFNSSLAIAINAIFDPFSLNQPRIFFTTTMFFLIIFFLFYFFVRTKETLERWEGAVLLSSYLLLVIIEIV